MSEPPAAPGLLRRVAGRLRRTAKQGISLAFNNVVMNNAAILLGLESQMKGWQHPYRTFRPSTGKKLQENAGFSDRPEINEVVQKMHADLAQLAAQRHSEVQPRKARALDIGCGPGLYLKDFSTDTWDVTGLDMNEGMCQLARETCPAAQIIQGNVLTEPLAQQFDLIYSISVLMYFERTSLDRLFQKIAQSLVPGGRVFINYPHAVSRWDLWYPDLTYIQYSPRLIQQIASKYLEIVEHRHSVDPRSIDLYDEKPYFSQSTHTNKSFRNSTVLIARRSAS